MICFLDLDGVLADFLGAAFRLHKITLDPYPPGVWDFFPHAGIAEADFYAPLDESFWAGLPWTQDGRQILAAVEETFGVANVCLLSSPTLHPGSLSGKYRWISEHLPQYQRRFLLGPPKHLLAQPGTVLVDDSDANVGRFRKEGGEAVLVPRAWNVLHAWRDSAVSEVRQRLGDVRWGIRA